MPTISQATAETYLRKAHSHGLDLHAVVGEMQKQGIRIQGVKSVSNIDAAVSRQKDSVKIYNKAFEEYGPEGAKFTDKTSHGGGFYDPNTKKIGISMNPSIVRPDNPDYKRGIESVVAHETGHYYDFNELNMEGSQLMKQLDFQPMTGPIQNNYQRKDVPRVDANFVSQYAETNPIEDFADTYAYWRLGKPVPDTKRIFLEKHFDKQTGKLKKQSEFEKIRLTIDKMFGREQIDKKKSQSKLAKSRK